MKIKELEILILGGVAYISVLHVMQASDNKQPG